MMTNDQRMMREEAAALHNRSKNSKQRRGRPNRKERSNAALEGWDDEQENG